MSDERASQDGGRIRPRSGSGQCGWSSTTKSDYPSQWKAIESIASEAVDQPRDPPTSGCAEPRPTPASGPGSPPMSGSGSSELEKENSELRRANEDLEGGLGFLRAWSSTRDCRNSRLHRRTPPTVRGRADLPGAHRARVKIAPNTSGVRGVLPPSGTMDSYQSLYFAARDGDPKRRLGATPRCTIAAKPT